MTAYAAQQMRPTNTNARGEKGLSCYNEDGSYIAIMIGRNRLRLYNREGRLIEEEAVSMKGGAQAMALGGGRVYKRDDRLVLAVGSGSGDVMILEWSMNRKGQLEKGGGTGKSEHCNRYRWRDSGRPSKIVEITAETDGCRFWICMEGGVIICLNVLQIRSGKEKLKVERRMSVGGYHSVATRVVRVDEARGRLWVGGQRITVHSVKSGKLVQQFTGHATPVVDLCVLRNGNALSACHSDAYISLWSCDEQDVEMGEGAAADRKRNSGGEEVKMATYTFEAPTANIRGLCVDAREDEGLSFGAIGLVGVAVWWRWTATSSGSVAPASVIVSSSSSVAHCCWTGRGSLMVVRGGSLKPSFFSVNIDEAEREVKLPDIDKTGLIASSSIKLEEMKERERKRLKMRDGSMADAPGTSTKGKILASEMEVLSESASEDDDGAADRDDKEETLAERLGKLGMDGGIELSGKGRTVVAKKNARNADTLVSVFEQAVQTQDRALFEQVLYDSYSTAVIRRTVEEMPTSLAAGKFFEALVDRFVQGPLHTRKIVNWLREVMTTHASGLMARHDGKAMKLLKETIMQRVESLEGLTRLEGRLELVLAQADRVKRTRVSIGTSPVVEYVETEEMIEAEKEGLNNDNMGDDSDTEDVHNIGDIKGNLEPEDVDMSEDDSEEDDYESTLENGHDSVPMDEKHFSQRSKRGVDPEDAAVDYDSEEASENSDEDRGID